jgi:hypothetical protein
MALERFGQSGWDRTGQDRSGLPTWGGDALPEAARVGCVGGVGLEA